MDENNTRFVEFDIYCKKCEYRNLEDFKDPCNECLEEPARIGTNIPLCYKEKK